MTQEQELKMLECASTISSICSEISNCKDCVFYNKQDEISSCCKLQVYFPVLWKGVALDIIDDRIKAKRKEIHELKNSPQDFKQ